MIEALIRLRHFLRSKVFTENQPKLTLEFSTEIIRQNFLSAVREEMGAELFQFYHGPDKRPDQIFRLAGFEVKTTVAKCPCCGRPG